MKVTVLGVITAIFIFLLLIAVLQNQIAPPPLSHPQATLEAVRAEATRAADEATHTATERTILATAAALQTETSTLQTRTVGVAASPIVTPK